MVNAMAMMAMWKTPKPLTLETPPVTVNSNEMEVQKRRMSVIPPVSYASENDVPISPTLLNEVEKALELTARNTAPPTMIPFYTPQAAPAPAYDAMASNAAPTFPSPAQPSPYSTSGGAEAQQVLMMGLPLFLVGSNIQALQTLASNPGLLASFKDVNGVYKQPELINLVQTLTQNVAPQASGQVPMAGYAQAAPAPASNPMFNAPPPAPNSFFQNQPTQLTQPLVAQQPSDRGGYRGDQNLGEANLHLSGYGPTTTNADIIAMFAPYVHVTEVVNKSNFSFVNTNDPAGAKRAREALHGSLLGGLPCRINPATRKSKNPNHLPGGGPGAAGVESLPRNALGQIDFDAVKDDRGNPATKNLFVAGYGHVSTVIELTIPLRLDLQILHQTFFLSRVRPSNSSENSSRDTRQYSASS